MSDERDLGSIGGSIEDIRRIASLDGGEVSEGKHYVDLPQWFTRLGRKHFQIDSGFGKVKVKVLAVKDNVLMGFMDGEPKAIKQILPCIVEMPPWEAEDDIKLDRDYEFKEGELLPPASEVAQRNPQVCAKYMAECLPISLAQQIVAGFKFMTLPPIAYTEVDPD